MMRSALPLDGAAGHQPDAGTREAHERADAAHVSDAHEPMADSRCSADVPLCSFCQGAHWYHRCQDPSLESELGQAGLFGLGDAVQCGTADLRGIDTEPELDESDAEEPADGAPHPSNPAPSADSSVAAEFYADTPPKPILVDQEPELDESDADEPTDSGHEAVVLPPPTPPPSQCDQLADSDPQHQPRTSPAWGDDALDDPFALPTRSTNLRPSLDGEPGR